jgi:hypothetical protein
MMMMAAAAVQLRVPLGRRCDFPLVRVGAHLARVGAVSAECRVLWGASRPSDMEMNDIIALSETQAQTAIPTLRRRGARGGGALASAVAFNSALYTDDRPKDADEEEQMLVAALALSREASAASSVGSAATDAEPGSSAEAGLAAAATGEGHDDGDDGDGGEPAYVPRRLVFRWGAEGPMLFARTYGGPSAEVAEWALVWRPLRPCNPVVFDWDFPM